MDSITKRKVARWKKANKKLLKCPVCKGTGTQEEKTKGYRRYLCYNCEGAKVVLHPYPNSKYTTKEKEKKK